MENGAVLTISVDTSEGRRRFGVLADAIKDINSVLRAFDEYKQGKIAELFATRGHGKWAPLSERGQQHAAARAREAATRAPSTLLKKLRKEHGRALERLAKLDPSAVTAKRLTTGQNAVARRAFVLEAFEKATQGIFIATANKKQEKLLAKIQPRWERAQARAAAKGNVLGNLPQTIRSKITGGVLTIDSSWDSPAPAVLQEGGKVNHGANIPPREWLAWEPEDIDMLANLLQQRAMLAWRS